MQIISCDGKHIYASVSIIHLQMGNKGFFLITTSVLPILKYIGCTIAAGDTFV